MTQTDIMIKMVLDRWTASIKAFDTLLNSLTDEDLQKEIAPGKNRGTYLLGHLVAVHDDMLRLLDLGEKKYPELFDPYIKEADNKGEEIRTVQELRTLWTQQCEDLNKKFEALTADQWFEKHTAVPAEEFVAEPFRNKLNIIITRTSHLQYHTGQVRLLK